MLRDLADHVVASSFRYVVHFIYSRFAAGKNTLYEKRSQIRHELWLQNIHSSVRLIFLAASTLTQPAQRPLSESNPIEKTGPPHFLHVAGSVISTYFMITSCVASYKEETKRLVFASQSLQNGLILDGLQKKTVKLRQWKIRWLF